MSEPERPSDAQLAEANLRRQVRGGLSISLSAELGRALLAELDQRGEQIDQLKAVADAAWNLHLVFDMDDIPQWAALDEALNELGGDS